MRRRQQARHSVSGKPSHSRLWLWHRRPRHRAARFSAATTAGLLLAGALTAIAVSAAPSDGATSSLSTFTKTGVDLATRSAVDSTSPTRGTAHAGDRVRWALNYSNKTNKVADVNIVDRITDGQNYVPGSLRTPPMMSASVRGSTLRATGQVQDGTTAATSPGFTTTTTDFKTPGGDGYSVEGYRTNIYTVFHHNDGVSVWNGVPIAGRTVFCATLDNKVCAGWPGYATHVDPKAGVPLGTGRDGLYVTAGTNGSLIVNGRLYWPVQALNPARGPYELGMQCLNLNTLRSCGLTKLATTNHPAPNYGLIAGDGIAASDGRYYYLDTSGNMLCFDPAKHRCGPPVNVTGGGLNWDAATAAVETYGAHVFTVVSNLSKPATTGYESFITCYDVVKRESCPRYPKNVGPSAPADYPGHVMPVVSSNGVVRGACAAFNQMCFDLAGNSIANPYPKFDYSGVGPSGLGTGVLLRTKYYTMVDADHAGCFDFARVVGGKVQPCSQFVGRPRSEAGYTVRSLANVPGCMAAAGDHKQITLFDAVTGAPCTRASQSVTLTPAAYYCDGNSGHVKKWRTVRLTGLNGSEYAGATLTLRGANNKVVPGWANYRFPAGSSTVDISSIPVTGNTATLKAEVSLVAVRNSAKVNASVVRLSWRGDPIQVCYETVMPNLPCAGTTSVSNSADAVTTAGARTDGPRGNSSGSVYFDVSPSIGVCRLEVAKSVEPGNFRTVHPGQVLVYLLTFHNSGSAEFPVSYVDDMADVVDDAVIVAPPTASSGALQVLAITRSQFRVTGTLAPGQTVTVHYSVKVKPYDQQRNHKLDNFLTLQGSSHASRCLPANALCTHNPVPTDHGTSGLPRFGSPPAVTGFNSRIAVILGGLALGVGALLMLAGTRRRDARESLGEADS